MMGKPIFSDEFQRGAMVQLTERGYPAGKVTQRLGGSAQSVHACKRQLAKAVSGDVDKDAGIRLLERERAQAIEERDVLGSGSMNVSITI